VPPPTSRREPPITTEAPILAVLTLDGMQCVAPTEHATSRQRRCLSRHVSPGADAAMRPVGLGFGYLSFKGSLWILWIPRMHTAELPSHGGTVAASSAGWSANANLT
jgi:hypothetical protein